MHPWLIQSWSITTYGFCAVVGVLIGWIIARQLAKRTPLDPSHIDLLVPILIATGLAGAYAFGWWTDAATDEAVHGRVLLGSLIGATAGGMAYAVAARIALGLLGDICAPAVAAGIACGRIGCFFAGCCYGKVSLLPGPLGAVRFPHGSFPFQAQVAAGLLPPDAATSLPVYPVQLYEAVLLLMLSVALAAKFSKRQISGERFLWLGSGYAAIRFPLEFLRADNPAVVGGMTFSQAGSLVVLAAAITTLLLRREFVDRWTLSLRPSPPPNPAQKKSRTGITGPTA